MTVKRRLVPAVLATAVLAVGLVLFLSRDIYKQWAWSDYPNPLTWCGSDWVPTGTENRADIESDNVNFRHSGDLPGLLNHGAVWTATEKGAEPATSCRITHVWVRTGTDRWETMSLEGGF